MADKIGKRIAIYLRKEQLEYLDAESKKENCSRSKYIERRTFPKELQRLEDRRGRPRNE